MGSASLSSQKNEKNEFLEPTIIYNWQKNRNPFIDLPELAEYIWGNKIGEYWNSNVGIENITNTETDVIFYPNPVVDFINLRNIEQGEYQILDLRSNIIDQGVFSNSRIDANKINHGMYLLIIKTDQKTLTAKFVK